MTGGDLCGRQSAFSAISGTVIDARLTGVSLRIRAFTERYRGKVDQLSPREFAASLRDCERFLGPLQMATTIAEARLAADAEDMAALALLDRCETFWQEIAEQSNVFEREIADLSPATVVELLASPLLASDANYVRNIRAAVRPPASVATAIAALDPTAHWERMARQLLGRIVVRDGDRQLSLGATLPGLYAPDWDRRRATTKAITAALATEVELRATALGGLALARVGRSRVSELPDYFYPEYAANQVSAVEVSALLAAVGDERSLVHRYYQAKSSLFDRPLTDADRYAPVGAAPTVTWTDAVEIVLASYARLGGRIAAVARELLDAGAVDALPRRGKRRGALTFTLPGGDSWVLMNFTGQARDVLTLAHELGHAVHARLAGHHGPLNAAIPTVLAETVGLFTEAVAAEHYGEQAADPDTRTALEFRATEDQLVAAFRQVALHDFEIWLHMAVADGDPPDAEALGAEWMRGQRELYGSAVTLDAGYRHWWSYVDNLYFQPGTRFSYAYGQLAAAALLARHRDDPAGFGLRFEELLCAGASVSPAGLLATFGLRAHEPEGWRIGLSALRDRVDRACGTKPQNINPTGGELS